MADRLSKLSQYLNSQNYELAIELHENGNYKIDDLQEIQIIKLAKAYHFIGNNYKKAVQLIDQIKSWKSIQSYYQARIILVKSAFLGSLLQLEQLNNILKELLTKIKNQLKQYHSYQKFIQEIYYIINSANKYKSNTYNLKQERKNLQSIFKQQDDNSIIMEGMPKFIISSQWLKRWQQYTQGDKLQRQKRHPGPITQFQILDHPFNIFYDKTQGKEYTNKYIFGNCKYEILPKKCWMFLKDRYGGIDIKRFNITFINKPNEIMTEVYLKKIQIGRSIDSSQQDLKYIWLQITKKETWQGVLNKLATIWDIGQIYEIQKNKLKPVNQSEILQEVDTVGKKYVFKNITKKDIKNKQKCTYKQCKNTEKLKYCQCKSVKYCSSQCQKSDRPTHKSKCELQKNYLKQESVIFKNFNLEQKAYGGMKGKVGLKNLGNTCYMNSGLQCLSNTKEITQYFMKDQFKTHINHRNPLGMKGNLACTYAQLVRQMWTGNSQVISPFKIKKVIGSYSTQFSGFGQQDSQQFISLLIDCLCEDLNLVKNKENFEISDDIKSDAEMSLQSEMNYAKRIQSYIRSLMVGQFKSTVTCSTCKRISVCFDPYLLISMPIPSNHEGHFYFIQNLLGNGAIKFHYEYNSTLTLETLAKQLISAYNRSIQLGRSQSKSSKIDYSKLAKISIDNLYFILVNRKNYAITKQIHLNQKIINLKGEDAELMCLQIPSPISKEEQLFLVQFIYEGRENRQKLQERCNLPRFFKMPKHTNPKIKEQLIIQCLSKGFKQERTTYHESIDRQRLENTNQTGRRFKTLLIYCKKQFRLKLYSESNIMNIGKLIQIKSLVTLDDCFHNFIQLEKLTGENTWYCNKCKDHKEATKHMEIYKSNKILVIPFKRFTRLNKIRTPVKFPIENFDIGPYLLSNKKKQKVLYDLYGVVNHYGTLGGGHYTAYCQNFLNKKWYEFNDSRVSQINRSQIVSGDSYVLFYRRRD